jgi:TonB family protein
MDALAGHHVGSKIGAIAIGNSDGGRPRNGIAKRECREFELVFVRDTAPCAVLRTHTLADGSFRLSSVRAGDYRVAASGLSDGYGIRSMTAGGLDLLFNSVRLVASTQTEVLIEVARVEDLRREKSSFLRVGDGLRSLCLMHKVEPVYPSQPRAAHIVGNVIMSIGFDENGYVNDVMVIQGHPLLIQSAIDAVRRWRYAPFVFQGTIVPGITTVVLPFNSKLALGVKRVSPSESYSTRSRGF